VTLVLLGVLAFIDGTLCGFRASAGRNPRIFLWGYYGLSMRRGALFALVAIALFLSVGLALRALGGEPTWSALLEAAQKLVLVYSVFAALVVAALGLYLVGSFDLGVLASVLVLGPFTLIRPLVIYAGALWAAASSDSLPAAAMSLAAAAVMANFERLLALGRPPWRGLEADPSGRG
jgi:hypothetical protein